MNKCSSTSVQRDLRPKPFLFSERKWTNDTARLTAPGGGRLGHNAVSGERISNEDEQTSFRFDSSELAPRSHGVLRTAKNIGWQPRESRLQQDNNQQGAFPLLKLGTDEVHITFHALDAVGRTAADISSQDLKILDYGKLPLRLLRFEHLANLPIRAGLIFDTSRSMLGEIKDNRATANLYASQLLRLGLDRAFLMRFDSDSKVLQDWTDSNVDLLHQLDAVGNDYRSRMGGTKLLRAVKALNPTASMQTSVSGIFATEPSRQHKAVGDCSLRSLSARLHSQELPSSTSQSGSGRRDDLAMLKSQVFGKREVPARRVGQTAV